jgi:TonB family protein
LFRKSGTADGRPVACLLAMPARRFHSAGVSGNAPFARIAAGLLIGLALAGTLAAQCRLFVQVNGDYFPVVKAEREKPCIWKKGRIETVAAPRYALGKAEEFLPACIRLHSIEARTTGHQMGAVGADINNQFEFSATLVSAFPLADVFLVLDCESVDSGKRIFVHEVGALKPWQPQRIEVHVPGDRPFGSGAYRLHLFAGGGGEVFQSEQPAGFREEMLARMIGKRIASVQQSELKLFFAPAPEYPAALRPAGLKGHAVVSVHVTARGEPRAATVASATDPAFGEAALGAIRLWRFLPRIRNGVPVEAEVSIPFTFEPPEKS